MSKFETLSGIVLLAATFVASVAASLADDWPMLSHDNTRNPVSRERDAPTEFGIAQRNSAPHGLKWSAALGHHSCGEPVVSGGLVFVGTNNSIPRDPSNTGDSSVLMCFRERDGKFLYQYVSPRLNDFRADWSNTSLSSSPLIENGRAWFCTNRAELICLDISSLQLEEGSPEVLWTVDLRERFSVKPSGIQICSRSFHCSVCSFGDSIYVTLPGGGRMADDAVRTPSLICVKKDNGTILWADYSPKGRSAALSYGNPTVAALKNVGQVIVAQCDGYIRAFDTASGDLIWKFNFRRASGLQPAGGDMKEQLLIVSPVCCNGRLFVCVGKDIETCSGPGCVMCIDLNRRGDISEHHPDNLGQRNPNSGLLWTYTQGDRSDGAGIHCTLAGVAVHDGLLVVGDSHGVIHCLDEKSGSQHWSHVTNDDQISGSALIVDGKIYVGTSGGNVFVFALSSEKEVLCIRECSTAQIEVSPIFANGVLYVMSRNELLAYTKR